MGDLMSNAHVPVINHGPNAGKPRAMSDIVLDRMRAAFFAVCRLRSNGYAIRDVQIIGRARPVVMVEHCPLCDTMIELNRAVFVLEGHDQCGALRVGQFLIDDLYVHVEWEERGRH